MEEKNQKTQENKMGVLPVNRLLLSMSVPIMISMLVSALYNIVDSVYVSRVSEDALNAVSLAFPVQNLMIAVATGTGVGINALLSKSLGEKNYERANRTASNGVFLAVCSFAVFALLGGLFPACTLRCRRMWRRLSPAAQRILRSALYFPSGFLSRLSLSAFSSPQEKLCTVCSRRCWGRLSILFWIPSSFLLAAWALPVRRRQQSQGRSSPLLSP